MDTGFEQSPNGIVLVCGLGRLGQHCVRMLRDFGVTVYGIEARTRSHWALPELPSQIERLVVGDCRIGSVLEQAEISRCRAILLVTGDDRVNLAAAFAARALNPGVRVVLRCAQDNLNTLLTETFGNFVALEPTRLSIHAFALAALGDETAGLISFGRQLIPVQRQRITAGHRWLGRRLHEVDGHDCRILRHVAAERAEPAAVSGFYRWDPHDEVRIGDRITYIERGGRPGTVAGRPPPVEDTTWRRLRSGTAGLNPLRVAIRLWREGSRIRRITIVSGMLLLAACLAGGLFYRMTFPEIGLRDALNTSLVLILGGYDEFFGELTLPFPIPLWLHLFSLGLTIAGTLFLGIVYATLTEQVLSARFRFRQQRPPPPRGDHVVLVGLGRVGQQIARVLQELKQPVLAIDESDLPTGVLPQLSLIVGNPRARLRDVNLPRARSLIALTDDEVANLEIALEAKMIHPQCRLVLRMDDPAFSGSVSQLVPGAQAFGTYAVAAEAFTAAALGETVHGLLHLDGETVLVIEYAVAAGDTLAGRRLAEIAYGYGLVPISHQRAGREQTELLPSEELDVLAGDRLIALATSEGVRRVEQGRLRPRAWRVRVDSAWTRESLFDATMAIARVSGCEIATARAVMSQLPGTLDVALYRHQAVRLVRELHAAGCRASLLVEAQEPRQTANFTPPETVSPA